MFSRMLVVAAMALATMAGSALASPRPAMPGPAGDVSASISPLFAEGLPSSVSFGLLNATARGSVPLGNGWHLEAQLVGNIFWTVVDPVQVYVPTTNGGYAHLWTPSSMDVAWGGFVGAEGFDGIFASTGVEARLYKPRGSIAAAVAATNFNAASFNTLLWTLNASANFFPTPNTRLGVRGAVLTGLHGVSASFPSDYLYEVGVEVEQGLGGRPISAWLGASAENYLGTDGYSVQGGLRLYFNQSGRFSLQAHERDVPFTFVLPAFLGL